MQRGLLILWFGIAAPLFFSGSLRADALPVSGAARVDGLAAVVGGLAPGGSTLSIFRSDVELRARIALLGAGAGEGALGLLTPALLRATFDEMFGEALIAAEAARLSLAPPDAADVQREHRRFVEAAGGEHELTLLLRAVGAEKRELDAIVHRRAVVTAFLTANLEGTLDVTPGELEKAYVNEDHPFRDRPLDQARIALKSWLEQRRLERAVSRWVASLRGRTSHRILAQY